MLIIGVGNPMRGDDGVGPIVARRLADLLSPMVSVTEQSGEGAALMDTWTGEEAVFVVDAVSSGAEPGEIVRLDAVEQAVPSSFFHYSSHAFGLAEAIELSRALDTLPHSLVIYGVEGASFASGEGLSGAVAEAANEVTHRIVREIRESAEDPAKKPRGTRG